MDGSNEPIDVAPILKHFGVLKTNSGDETSLDKSSGNAFLDAMQDLHKLKDCVSQLFPNEIPVGQPFFDQLDEFHRWIGVSESGAEAIGLVWSEAMRRLSRPQQYALLECFAQQQGHAFFENLRSVWIVARDHEFPAVFLAEWFVTLIQAVERDIMQEDAWKTVRTVCTSHHRAAVEVLQHYLSQSDERRSNIASYMLGVLRSERLDVELADAYGKIERDYRDNENHSRRAVFNWSWETTARDRKLTEDELKRLIARSESSADDLNNIVCVICRLIQIERFPQPLLKLAVQWVGETLSPTLSSNAKYYVVNAASRLYRHSQKGALPNNSQDWILAIQPVRGEDRATWNRIGGFLCDVLNEDIGDLTSMLIQLCSISAKIVHGLMADRELRHLLHELGNHDAGSLVAKLALSRDTDTRQVGLFLFNELEVDKLPSADVESSDSVSIQLLFYEAQRTILSPKAVGRVLAAVAFAVEKTPSEFRVELLDELKLQCRNFSGGCRQELERLANGHPLVAEAMMEVAEHFDALKIAHEAGINAMDVTGVRKAAREQRRRFDKQVSESMKSASPLLSMVKHVSLLYGRSSSQFIDGVLRDATPLVQTSHSMEVPMVDFFDPEEMALRRLHASAMINRLLGERGNESEGPDER